MVYLAERWWWDNRGLLLFTAAVLLLFYSENLHITHVSLFTKLRGVVMVVAICVCKEGTEKFHNAVIIV